MSKDTIRRRIHIPVWRVDDLEAWLSGMSAKGWELSGMAGSTAIFRRAAPQHSRFYCHIMEPCKEEHYLKIIEDRERQVQEVTALSFTPVGGNEHIHVFRCERDCLYPNLPEEETERIVALYKRTAKKVSTAFWAMLLLLFKVVTSLLDPLKLLTMPGGLIELFALAAALVGFLSLTAGTAFNAHRIREAYRVQSPHQRQYDPSPDAVQRRYYLLMWAKRLLYGMAVYVLFLGPIGSWGIEVLLKGENPPIPAGDLPVVRISDLRPYLPVSASPADPEDNYYHSLPHLLLPESVDMRESTSGVWMYSRKYRAAAGWYAGLLVQAAAEEALGDLVEHDSPAKYGLDRLLYDPMAGSLHHIVAQKGCSVYVLIFSDETIGPELLFAAIGRKAGD